MSKIDIDKFIVSLLNQRKYMSDNENHFIKNALKQQGLCVENYEIIRTADALEGYFKEGKWYVCNESCGNHFKKGKNYKVVLDGSVLSIEGESGITYPLVYDDIERFSPFSSKFKVGDWIISRYGRRDIHYIAAITGLDTCPGHLCYVYDNGFSAFIKDADWSFRLWKPEDTTNGDVLALGYDPEKSTIFISKGGTDMFDAHVGVSGGDYFFFDSPCCLAYKNEVHPATKEQLNFLYDKMEDKDVWWDADKKELKIGDNNNEPHDFEKLYYEAAPTSAEEYICTTKKAYSIDVDEMVEEFANSEIGDGRYGTPSAVEVDAYRRGLNDILKKLEGE